MKSKWIIAAALLFISNSVSASANSVGLLGGLSLSESTIYNDNLSISLDTRTGIAAGVTSEFDLNGEWLYFQPELLFIQKGAKLESGADTAKFNFNYLELPLLLKTKFHGGPVVPSFMFGPSVGYLTSAAATVSLGGVTQSESITEAKDFELSLSAGAGIETALTDSVTGFLDIRYLYGLTNISKDPGDEAKWKNRTWLFLVGARFGI